MVPKGLKQVLICIALFLTANVADARSRRNPTCNEDQQKKMTDEFQLCLGKFTKEHHEATGKATTAEQYQKHTCKLLSDTVECGELWKRCHSADEVRTIQDTHIQARITQFRDNREGIDVFKCPVVEEYINSGRADQIDQSTEGACSLAEVSQVQKDFQDCSHNQSLSLYETLQSLEEGRFSRETNELNGELAREDSEPASLDPLKDIKPRLCDSLEAIAKECIESFNKCFSREDSQQIKRQHIQQMQQYYAKIYEGAGDLSDCPQIIKLEKEEEEYEEDQMEANDEEVTDDEEYDDYDNYYDEDEDDEDLESTSSSSTTSTTTSYPDPEGNFVIAEPPSQHLGGASPASKVTFAAFTMAFMALSATLLT